MERGGRGILVGVCPKLRNFGLSGQEAEGVEDHTGILCPEILCEQQQQSPVMWGSLFFPQDLLFTGHHQETIIAPAFISFVHLHRVGGCVNGCSVFIWLNNALTVYQMDPLPALGLTLLLISFLGIRFRVPPIFNLIGGALFLGVLSGIPRRQS